VRPPLSDPAPPINQSINQPTQCHATPPPQPLSPPFPLCHSRPSAVNQSINQPPFTHPNATPHHHHHRSRHPPALPHHLLRDRLRRAQAPLRQVPRHQLRRAYALTFFACLLRLAGRAACLCILLRCVQGSGWTNQPKPINRPDRSHQTAAWPPIPTHGPKHQHQPHHHQR